MTTAERRVAEALGQLLLRDVRAGVYGELVAGIDGLDPTTYPVLSGLARQGDTTSSRLAAAIGLDRSVTSRHLTTLEHQGLVTRRAHHGDRRATMVTLTADGHTAVDRTRQRLDEVLATFLADYPRAEVDSFVVMLGALALRLRARP